MTPTRRLGLMPGSRTAAGADPVGETPARSRADDSFRPVVHLTKGEALDACQALADADRVLVAAGRPPRRGPWATFSNCWRTA